MQQVMVPLMVMLQNLFKILQIYYTGSFSKKEVLIKRMKRYNLEREIKCKKHGNRKEQGYYESFC